MRHVFCYDRTLFCPSRIPLHKPLMAMGHIYLFQCTSHKSALVFSHRTSLENINIKFCPSLNWTLFCYGRTHFLLLHLAKGVQAGHLTSALHRHTTQQHRLHCTMQPTVIRQHILLALSTIINYYIN